MSSNQNMTSVDIVTSIKNQPAGIVTLTSLTPSTAPDPPHVRQESCTKMRKERICMYVCINYCTQNK